MIYMENGLVSNFSNFFKWEFNPLKVDSKMYNTIA